MLRVLSRLTVLVVLLGVLSLSDATVGLTAAPTDRQDAARQLLATPAARFLTPQAATALATVANGARRLGEDASIGEESGSQAGPRQQTGLAPSAASPAGVANVRVNDPGEDTHQPD